MSHILTKFLTPPPPKCVTSFMDGPHDNWLDEIIILTLQLANNNRTLKAIQLPFQSDDMKNFWGSLKRQISINVLFCASRWRNKIDLHCFNNYYLHTRGFPHSIYFTSLTFSFIDHFVRNRKFFVASLCHFALFSFPGLHFGLALNATTT